MTTSNNGSQLPYGIPPHLVPLDDNYIAVESSQELKLHLVHSPCRYAPTIDVWHRIYHNTTPDDGGVWCFYCEAKYKALKRAEARRERA